MPISAFCCLIGVATIYAAMSSEQVLGGRINIEAIICGVAFAAAITTLLFGLVSLVEALELHYSARWFRFLTGSVLPIIACGFICMAFNNAEAVRRGEVSWTAVSTATAISMSLVTATVLLAFTRPPNLWHEGHHLAVPGAAIAVTVACGLAFAITPRLSPDTHMPYWANVAGALLAGVVSSALALSLDWLARQRSPRVLESRREPALRGQLTSIVTRKRCWSVQPGQSDVRTTSPFVGSSTCHSR